MKRITLITIVTTLILGSCGVPQEDYNKLKSELEKTKKELSDCSTELSELKNTAENRFIRAKKITF